MTDPVTEIAGFDGAPNLAVEFQADVVTGTFVWGESYWDSEDLFGYDQSEGGWTNAICDVTRIAIRRGATRQQGILTRTEAGTCSVSLLDTNRRFDPMVNADVVHPGTPFRIRVWGRRNAWVGELDGGGPISSVTIVLDAGGPTSPTDSTFDGGTPEQDGIWSEVLFTGRIGADGLHVAYAKTGPPTVTIEAVDRVGPLVAWQGPGRDAPGVGAGDDLLARVTRTLEEMGLPASVVAEDVDTAYAATLNPSALANPWDDVNAAVDAELGRVWIDRYDRIVSRARDSQLSGPVRGTLSDIHDEIAGGTVHCCYDDADVVYDSTLLVNRAIAGRTTPQQPAGDDPPVGPQVRVVAQVDDEVSQAWHEVHAVDRRSLELETDEQLRPWAEALVLGQAKPELRVDSVSVAPWRAPEAWPQVAATDIGDRWAFRLRPEVGSPVERTLGILGVEHDITPARWTTVWHTVEAPTPGANNPSGWFVWDLSEWDGPDLLASIGGAVP